MKQLLIFTAALLLAAGHLVPAQEQTRSGVFERTAVDVGTAVGEAADWYDAPLVLLWLGRNYYKADNPDTKLVELTPMEFEKEFADEVGNTGAYSLGSMDSDILPRNVFLARVAWAVGNNLLTENNMKDEYAHAFAFQKALVYNQLVTELLKNTISRTRPDKSDTKSFISGHTSTTFTASSFLYREINAFLDEWKVTSRDPLLRTSLKILSFATLYGWAGYVGWSRIHDNKHYITDVLAGALAGVLIGNLVYDSVFSEDTPFLPDLGVTTVDSRPAISLSIQF